jgi:predicted NUDIX family NTP pyrophosphohydrolase
MNWRPNHESCSKDHMLHNLQQARPLQSAGLLLYRCKDDRLEVLLGHPGGPYWIKRDAGAWGIPKGSINSGEAPLEAARREFTEETGHKPLGEVIELGTVKQTGGKIVHAWGMAGDWDPTTVKSNMFEMEWPPRSGRRRWFPEIDRAAWFDVARARVKILKSQAPFIERLFDAVRQQPSCRPSAAI